MKSFLKYLLASFIGTGIALAAIFFLIFLFGIAIASSAGSSGQMGKSVTENSVLKLKISESIPERKNNVEPSQLSFETDDVYGFYDILQYLEKAGTSDKIKGLFLDMSNVALGHTQVHDLTNALEDFKAQGKFVYAYSDYFSQHTYLVATAADSIFMHPLGKLELKGYGTVVPYMKEFSDKLGIDVEIFNTGDFKSAGENFTKKEMSDANRQQTKEYLSSMQAALFDEISENRNLDAATIDQYADDFLITSAREGIEKGLIDVSAYEHQVLDYMKDRLGLGDKKLKLLEMKDYMKSTVVSSGKGEDKIALVFAEGNIVDDTDDKGIISDKIYVPLIDKLTKDEDVKAMVLRVNSGGGSVMSSDNIHAALERFKAADKKVVVSMGDLAASGGYYISMNADHIYAKKTTITGSIGVVSIIPNFERMFEDKLGIYWDTVTTDPLATGFSTVTSWSEKESKKFQKITDEFYEVFLSKVSDGRGIPVDDLREIAGGRVWTGAKAVDLGLVDEIGGIEEALSKAAELVDLEEYRIQQYPKFQSPLMELLSEFQDESAQVQLSIEDQLKSYFPEISESLELFDGGQTQAVLLERIIY